MRYWEAMYLRADPPNLVAKIRTLAGVRRRGPYRCRYDARSIYARALQMPGRTDL